MGEMIRLTSSGDGFEFTALHAQPEGSRKGGVIVLQEIFGIDAYVRADVARWAALGFEVLAPSLFDRLEPGFVADHTPEGRAAGIGAAQKNGFDNPMGDVQACIDFLKPRGPVFAVGYCYGGSLVWMAAGRTQGLSAGSSYYGSLVAGFAGLTPKCPVICHFGRKDGHIPAAETEAAVKAAQPQVPVHVYENSGHGFNNDGMADADPADAALARERTLKLFEANGAG